MISDIRSICMSKHVVVFLADGFEEIEAVTPVDLLRRAGFTVKMISISNSLFVTGSRGIIIQADKLISEVNLPMAVSSSMLPSAIILPGGLQGAKNLASASIIGSFVEEMLKAGKLVCAICASPVVVLSPLGVLKNRKYTCYPGMEKEIEAYAGRDWKEKTAGSEYSSKPAVFDDGVLTSSAAGTAAEFSLEIIRLLEGDAAADETAEKTLFC